MPFTCKFQLNNGAISENDKVVFINFVDSSFDKYQTGFVKIATVYFNNSEAFIYSTCKCFPSSKGNLKSGDLINTETIIGYFSADGEEIPYNKPYAEIKVEKHIQPAGNSGLASLLVFWFRKVFHLEKILS
nr:hypothetical protein [uncultured Flavobacterium sp.]